MPKKLAVGARKAAMEGKRSATKRELIDAGVDRRPATGHGQKQLAKPDRGATSRPAERRMSLKKRTG